MADIEQRVRGIIENIAKAEKYENHEIKVHAVNTAGANYTSSLFSATVVARGKPGLKLFVKVAMIGEKIRALSQTPMFEVETIFYTKVLPRYRELEERYCIPEDERLSFAKYYGGTTEYMKEMLVLEDLTSQGYRSFDRLNCYDWDFASECVTLLARLHALSVAYEKDYPIDYAKMRKIFTFNFILHQSITEFNEKCIATAVKATEEKYKQRVEKYLRYHSQEKNLLKYYKPERTMLFHHGDFRLSNMLQKIENGRRKLLLVDHQLIDRGNPIRDLLFFLISGSDEKFRLMHLHQYFDHYYEELSKALARFHIAVKDIYKRKDYEDDVKELLPFGLTLGAFTLPIITVDASNAPKSDVQIDFENLEMEVSELFSVRFNGLVRDYVRMGML